MNIMRLITVNFLLKALFNSNKKRNKKRKATTKRTGANTAIPASDGDPCPFPSLMAFVVFIVLVVVDLTYIYIHTYICEPHSEFLTT